VPDLTLSAVAVARISDAFLAAALPLHRDRHLAGIDDTVFRSPRVASAVNESSHLRETRSETVELLVRDLAAGATDSAERLMAADRSLAGNLG
jgi:hypothetical protein